MNSPSLFAASTLSFFRSPALGTRSAIASPRLVIVKLLPDFTCLSNSGSLFFPRMSRSLCTNPPRLVPPDRPVGETDPTSGIGQLVVKLKAIP